MIRPVMSLWQKFFGPDPNLEIRIRELESAQRIEAKADRELIRVSAEHDRIIRNLKWFGSIALGLVVFVLGGSCIELRQTANTAAEEAAKGVKAQVEARVDTEFKQENIRQTISEAAE